MARFSPKNFGKQNTPPLAQKIGNTLLLSAAIGGAIVMLPTDNPYLIIPSVLMSIGHWLVAVGSIGKVITKFFGENQTPQDNGIDS